MVGGDEGAGDHIWEKMQTMNPTFELYVLWDRNYITSDANVIKVRRTLYDACLGADGNASQSSPQSSPTLSKVSGPLRVLGRYSTCPSGERFNSFMKSVLGTGVFNSDGASFSPPRAVRILSDGIS